jgi:hypothetical protein
MISDSHPLHKLFLELVNQHFSNDVSVRDRAVSEYVARILTDFCDMNNLLKIHNTNGRSLDDAGEMLMEADPVFGAAPSFDREREVRKHIGDYTLFFTGMFPESINRLRLRCQRLEGFIDFMKAGKESYYIVSKFEHFEYAQAAPLFAQLSKSFEQCVFGLNMVKNDLAEMQHPIVRTTKELLM